MSFSTASPRNDYTGNNTTAVYGYGFRIFDQTDLQVIKVLTSTGARTILAIGTDYTVDNVNNPAGGNVTLVAGNLPTGYTLTIRMNRTAQQQANFRNQKSLFPAVIEDKFDEIVRFIQTNADDLGRALKLPQSEVGADATTVLAAAAARASKFLAFDASGNLVMAAGTSANLGPVSGYINTLLPAVDAPTARTTLGALAKGGDNLTGGLNEAITTIASATTPDIFAVAVGNTVNYTGVATATGFAAAPQAGARRTLVCAGAAIFTAGANMLIDGIASGSNFTAAAGDKIVVLALTTTQFLLTPLKVNGKAVVSVSGIQPIGASVAANALTISASGLSLDFRSPTLSSGAVVTVGGAPANLVISAGSTLGTVSGVASRLAVLALNNAGSLELAVSNLAGGVDLTETGVISTTAEGGGGGATSATVVYSTTARTGVAYRVIGYLDSTQATAGTWATAPSTIQGCGGQALAALSSVGYSQTWQNVTGSRSSGVTYYNTTGRPIAVAVVPTAGGGVLLYLLINAVGTTGTMQPASTITPLFGIVPPGGSYSYAGGITNWSELR